MDSRLKQTVMEMMHQRNFCITLTDEPEIILVENESDDRIIIFYNSSSKLDNERLKQFISLTKQGNLTHAIIIYKNSVTHAAKKIVEELSNAGDQALYFELFNEDSLRYNITKHRLVPKHMKLSDEEAKEFKKKFGLKMPILLHIDPIARFFNYQKGDIIRIERKDAIAYRIVR